jgi:hypothetical protein
MCNLSNIDIIQRYQSKMLRTITTAPRYVTNQALYQDLRIQLVRTVFRERTATHRTTVSDHQNPLMISLINPPNIRRLKRRWTFDGTTYGRVAGLSPARHQMSSH